MGIDFIRKAAKPFHKGLDRDRVELGTPDLFTQHPESAPRGYTARVHDGMSVTTGERLVARLEGSSVVACRGIDAVATFQSPPAELAKALSSSHGVACAVVQEYYPLARAVEVVLS